MRRRDFISAAAVAGTAALLTSPLSVEAKDVSSWQQAPRTLNEGVPPAPFQFRYIPKGVLFGGVALRWDFDGEPFGIWVRYTEEDLADFGVSEAALQTLLRDQLLATAKSQLPLISPTAVWEKEVQVKFLRSRIQDESFEDF